ncbi:MAG: transposase [Lachnospiraceae bacterium]|jgi:hypothetical protein|nr:transposase [Lachnospiraceae bacterium]
MYRSGTDSQIGFTDFNQPAGYQLDPENEWVKRADRVPWNRMESRYAALFPSRLGNVAVPFRAALGTLIIQTHYGFTDRATMSFLTGDPYLEYFIGMPGYTPDAPFLPSSISKFRRRFSASFLCEVNETVAGPHGRLRARVLRVLPGNGSRTFLQTMYRFRAEYGSFPVSVTAPRSLPGRSGAAFAEKHRIRLHTVSGQVFSPSRRSDAQEKTALAALSLLSAVLFDESLSSASASAGNAADRLLVCRGRDREGNFTVFYLLTGTQEG